MIKLCSSPDHENGGSTHPHFHGKSRLKVHGFNRGMKGGVARCPLKRALRATSFVFGCCSMNKKAIIQSLVSFAKLVDTLILC